MTCISIRVLLLISGGMKHFSVDGEVEIDVENKESDDDETEGRMVAGNNGAGSGIVDDGESRYYRNP